MFFVAIQRPLHVDLNDVTLKVLDHEDDWDDDAQYFETFIIEHEYIGDGFFTVMVSPYSHEQHSVMCEEPSKFTVDKETLFAIYSNPARFILDYVVKYDSRYNVFNEDEEKSQLDEEIAFNIIDGIPEGFTVVRYMHKDGSPDSIIAYNDDPQHVYNEKEIKQLDETLGVGKYVLMDAVAAKAFIEAEDERLNKLSDDKKKTDDETVS